MKELLETGAAGDLEYCESCDALIGKIKDLAVAIKENNETKSYGCLIWVGPTGDADPEAAKAFLAEQAASKPHIIKHYRAAGRGAAIAMVKYNDAARNINNINRLIGEISDGLFARSYENCCYRCGSTEKLSIYSDNGVPVLYCSDCGRGTVLRSFGGQAVPVQETPVISADDPLLGGLLADGTEETSAEPKKSTEINDDNIDLSALLFAGVEEEAAAAEAPRSELFEAAQREFDEQKKLEAEESDNSLDSLMFVAGEDKTAEEQPAPAVTVSAPTDSDISELGGLMFDGTENAEPEEQPDVEEKAAENANIDTLMYDAEEFGNGGSYEEEPVVETQAPAAEGSDIDGLMVGEIDAVTAVTAIGRGEGEDLQVATQEEEYVGLDDNIAVTEIHDDSNDGEDIEVTELDPTLNVQTADGGVEITAGETPLEADGSVPLVNPNSGFADIKPSSAYGPGAVKAYAAGSYDNATAADEPVGFDGRPKGSGPVRDPRLGDEMGVRSRDFRSQQVSEPDKHRRKTGSRKVSGNAKASKNANFSYTYGSKGVVGTIAALIFGLVGAGLWAGAGYLLDMTGTFEEDTASLIVAVCAFLPTLFVFVGYRIGGDFFDKKGIIISAVVTVILDAVGAFALFVTSELRWTAENFGYSVSLDKAIERALQGISGASTEVAIYGRLLIIAVIMVISLAAGVVVAIKKSEQ